MTADDTQRHCGDCVQQSVAGNSTNQALLAWNYCFKSLFTLNSLLGAGFVFASFELPGSWWINPLGTALPVDQRFGNERRT